MNLKSKIFGILAASVVALSMMGGAFAADSATSDVGLKLTETECSVSFTQGSDLFFGEWTWNGTEYQQDWQSGEKPMNASLVSGSPRGCDVTIAFNGMSGAQYGNHIPNSAFAGTLMTYGPLNLGSVPGLATGFSLTPYLGQLHTNQYGGSLALTDPNDVVNTLRGDDYSGQIVVTVSDAA